MTPNRIRAVQGWEVTWFSRFVQTDAFTVGFLGTLIALAVSPVTVACAHSLFSRGDLGACLVVAGLGAALVVAGGWHAATGVRAARHSYRATRRRRRRIPEPRRPREP